MPRIGPSPLGRSVDPGVMMYTGGAQCTANFIYSDGTSAYIGYAAHCSGTGAATDTNGCTAASLPLGTSVEIDGATRPGTLVYNSWLAMQAAGETDPDACNYNDLALVKIDAADIGRTNPSIPFFGGPTGLDRDGSATGAEVYSYGNSSLRLGLANNVSDLAKALDYMHAHGGPSATVVNGTEPFSPIL